MTVSLVPAAAAAAAANAAAPDAHARGTCDSESATRARGEGNAAFAAGDFAAAEACYTAALQQLGHGSSESDKREAPACGVAVVAAAAPDAAAALLSNRSAARLALGDANGALHDADAAACRAPGWAKAHARVGAAQAALRNSAGAVASYLRAYSRRPEPGYEQELVAQLLACCRGIAVLTRPDPVSGRYGPGSLRADACLGAYEAVAEACAAATGRGAAWSRVRLAATLQLAALAADPGHKIKRFLGAASESAPNSETRSLVGGPVCETIPDGLSLLAAWADDDSHVRLTLTADMDLAWRHVTGRAYAASSLLLPAAVGLASLLKHPSALPGVDLPRLFANHPRALRALGALVSGAAGCTATLSAAATAYVAVVPAGLQGWSCMERAIAAGVGEALPKLRIAFLDAGLEAEAERMRAVERAFLAAPDHPDNFVPGRNEDVKLNQENSD